MRTYTAYLPLTTYPGIASDSSILATLRLAESLDCALHVETFAVSIPHMTSPTGDLLINIPALIKTAEVKSLADCRRIGELVKRSFNSKRALKVDTCEIPLGAALDVAASSARYHDLSIVPWEKGSLTLSEMSEAVVFGSGCPSILVPSNFQSSTISNVAIAWDESRVAARALQDVLNLVTPESHVSVLTVSDEKPLKGINIAAKLAKSLQDKGYNATSLDFSLGERSIGTALQVAATELGAQLLAMGGFGHSRIRDFVLGGATKGVLAELQMPVLLSH